MLHLEVPLCTQLWRRQPFHRREVSSSQKQARLIWEATDDGKEEGLGQKRGSYPCGHCSWLCGKPWEMILVMRNGAGVGHPHLIVHCTSICVREQGLQLRQSLEKGEGCWKLGRVRKNGTGIQSDMGGPLRTSAALGIHPSELHLPRAVKCHQLYDIM